MDDVRRDAPRRARLAPLARPTPTSCLAAPEPVECCGRLAAVSAAYMYARCTSVEGKVECVGALVDSIKEACSPTSDPSLVEYLDQFWRWLQRSPDELFGLKQMVLYHWQSGAPLEFVQHTSFDRDTFAAEEGTTFPARLVVPSHTPKPLSMNAEGMRHMAFCPEATVVCLRLVLHVSCGLKAVHYMYRFSASAKAQKAYAKWKAALLGNRSVTARMYLLFVYHVVPRQGAWAAPPPLSDYLRKPFRITVY
eukprot:877219-Prymnesium_polylepis.1